MRNKDKLALPKKMQLTGPPSQIHLLIAKKSQFGLGEKPKLKKSTKSSTIGKTLWSECDASTTPASELSRRSKRVKIDAISEKDDEELPCPPRSAGKEPEETPKSALSFTLKELKDFESLYSDELYTSMIREGPEFQLDMSKFSKSNFGIKIQPHFASRNNKRNPDFIEKCERARMIVKRKLGKSISDSQVLDLMLNCETEEDFWRVVKCETFLLAEYLNS